MHAGYAHQAVRFVFTDSLPACSPGYAPRNADFLEGSTAKENLGVDPADFVEV